MDTNRPAGAVEVNNKLSLAERIDRKSALFDPCGLALVALFLANICLAMGPWLVRVAGEANGIGPLSAAFWRLTLAIPLLLVISRTFEPSDTRPPIRRLIVIAAVGVIFAADLASWHLGIVRTKLANASLFGNSTSLLFPIYGFIIARAAPSRLQVGALAFGLAGALIMLGRSYELSPDNFIGDALCLLAGALYTIYLIAIDRARTQVGAWTILSYSTIGGAPALLLFALIAGERIWPDNWTSLIALALVAQVIGQALMIYALGKFKPVVIGVALLVQPIVGSIIGLVGYGELLGVVDVVGALCIAGAMILVLYGRTNKADLFD
jgi:drug/metabolite transporter (DMT)-like permease